MFGSRPEDTFVNAPRGGARSGAGWPFLVAVALGIGAFLWWAATYQIEESTRGLGRVVPSARVQVVQSLEGGIVAGIDVAEGDVVEAGQVLMQIDDTGFSAARGELLEQEATLLAKEARLRAEAASADTLALPAGLVDRAPAAVAAERDVFRSRRIQLDGELRLLNDRLAQRRAELAELRATMAKLDSIIAPLEAEVALTEGLVDRGSVPQIELLRLQGRLAETHGDRAVGAASLPRLEAAIRAAEAEVSTTRSAYVLTAREQMSDLRLDLAVVQESLRAATDRVSRTALKAPVKGTVNRIHATTLGAVVQPGQPLVEIVPAEDRLLIEADIRPRDVAFIRPGDRASVKITAYDYLIYGALEGEVLRIGADTVEGAQGQAFFRVTVETTETHLTARGQEYPISPGMIAQIDIQTGTRTVLSYLAKPILRARSEALHER